ncbi:sulfatase [Sulfitobacter sp. SK012]|uniref:sulfatase-like hydrolase/transferase n=1 Tax=Sulfitobacter sp. SK012 TaxID=1389005 RepID=UPI000E0B9D4D|nr:sulfatase-like hydrolase/transferase [Sulfitobacter sp. SK012]AXI45521.1 sulfatase [Sulfitobacter sp. SK012]
MVKPRKLAAPLTALTISALMTGASAQDAQIVHDAEYYILEAQNGTVWEVEDGELDAKLAELREQYGRPPNIIHYMFDDQPPMSFGDEMYQQIRGYKTPNLNQLAADGMMFSRMYTEPGCTPSRAAVLTGQNAIRTGTWEIGFPIEYTGLAAENVTMAEVLSGEGYATAFFGKLHLGDTEESYPINQGFDEAFWAVYNQVTSLYNKTGEGANAIVGMKEELLADNPYQLDKNFVQDDAFVFYLEGKKGEQVLEWRDGSQEVKDYYDFDIEGRERAINFIRRSAEAEKPFYVAWWPLWIPFIPAPEKVTLQRGMVGENYQRVIEPDIAAMRETLEELGIAENTLVVVMADNGPMTHNPPPGAGLGEGLFRGGKGDFTEGGVRVPAAAFWPGVIEPGQMAADMIHQTDLFTTFARLAGATQHIPTDRIIDGIDQTSLLLNGDTHGRRDHVFIYQGPDLAATVKDQYKIHWTSNDPGQAKSGLTAVYDLYNDHREVNPIVVGGFHFKEPFKRMRARHELWKEKYPDRKHERGPAYTGISNARPATLALSNPPVDYQNLPFDPMEFISHLDKLPFNVSEPGFGE